MTLYVGSTFHRCGMCSAGSHERLPFYCWLPDYQQRQGRVREKNLPVVAALKYLVFGVEAPRESFARVMCSQTFEKVRAWS